MTFSVSYAGDIFSVSNDVITVDDLVATFDAATVPGQSAQGAALTVTGVADNHTDVSESVTYAWRVYDTETNSWTTVGTGSSYTPSESDEDHQLQLVVTYANDPSGSQSTTYNFGTVQEIAGDDTVVSIGGLSDGNAVEGTPVTATITDGGLAVVAPPTSGSSMAKTLLAPPAPLSRRPKSTKARHLRSMSPSPTQPAITRPAVERPASFRMLHRRDLY